MGKIGSLAAGAVAMTLLIGTALAQDFSTEAWIAEGEKSPSQMSRNHMIDAIEQALVPGMSEDDVIALLGEPQRRSASELTYELGVAPYGIDFEYLVVTLGADGTFETTSLRRD